ncbi:TlpA family protein disulfide reductase [Acetobacter oeni]|nr:TlpA disulfide reductase family protein [Acetobacter oeni]MBB3881302.1 thiol-disulfide isomerase/thioredoxin [Acetobacter oeni]GBR08041.1 thiol-disulfide isomerase [Acetobacter oeni LMG 21952]
MAGTLMAALAGRKPLRAATVDDAPVAPWQIAVHAPQILPTLTFTDSSGDERDLISFRGQPAILHLWATWCGPCVTELPALAALAPSLQKSGIVVIPVAVDHLGPQKVPPFLARLNLRDFTSFYDTRAGISAALEEQSLPFTLLLNHDMQEVGRHAGPVRWDDPDAVASLRRLLA